MSKTTITAYLFLIFSLLLLISCEEIPNTSSIDDSLDTVDDVSLITGTENTVMTVNQSNLSYFTLTFQNVGNNNVIGNGNGEGWCIDWQKPIDSNGGTYNNTRLYSTFNVPEWNRVNYLLNIKDQLMAQDSEVTYKEIQLAIWSLRGRPEFNLDEIAVRDLPSRMLNNGQPAFNRAKVDLILQIVEAGFEDFDFAEGTKYAVIAETPADVQTVITVVE